MTAALIAQVEVAPSGLSSSLFTPLFLVALIYVALYVAGTVLENRGDARGPVVADVAFALLLLMGVYVAVLLVTALAQKFDLIVRMVEVVAIVVVFFALLIVVFFAVGIVFGAIGRLIRRDERVTTAAADESSA